MPTSQGRPCQRKSILKKGRRILSNPIIPEWPNSRRRLIENGHILEDDLPNMAKSLLQQARIGQGLEHQLKVHKRENFLGSDIEICTFS
jgi:hypothetical protein